MHSVRRFLNSILLVLLQRNRDVAEAGNVLGVDAEGQCALQLLRTVCQGERAGQRLARADVHGGKLFKATQRQRPSGSHRLHGGAVIGHGQHDVLSVFGIEGTFQRITTGGLDLCVILKDARQGFTSSLFDYYGIEFDISSVFPDMIEENTGSYGIFKFSDGSDMQGHNFIWANPIGNEKVSIEIIKDGAPKSDNTQVTNDSAPLASTISGENVNIFRFDSDEQSGYYAEFVHKSLGFTVYGYNFDKDDFVRILSYLISC